MAEDILNRLAAAAKRRVVAQKREVTLSEMKRRAEEALDRQSFLEALRRPGMSYICEIKRASPSRGLIAADFPYGEIAQEYEGAGAGAISVLTEPEFFLGSDRYLKEIAAKAGIPVLRKDFTVDEYMIYQAKALGASAVLLIVSLLDERRIRDYRLLAEELGMDALVEAHSDEETVIALDSGAKIIGVNNRNLRNFTVDTENSVALRHLVPPDVVFVSESGIRTAGDVRKLKEAGVDAVLIGETLMRSGDKAGMLKELDG